MAKQKKPVHRVEMTEGKRNIIHQLLEEYDNLIVIDRTLPSEGKLPLPQKRQGVHFTYLRYLRS